jgi:hypothetical protein
MTLSTLTEGQKCPTCGHLVVVPMHSCHPVRDNYVVVRQWDEEPKTWDQEQNEFLEKKGLR